MTPTVPASIGGATCRQRIAPNCAPNCASELRAYRAPRAASRRGTRRRRSRRRAQSGASSASSSCGAAQNAYAASAFIRRCQRGAARAATAASASMRRHLRHSSHCTHVFASGGGTPVVGRRRRRRRDDAVEAVEASPERARFGVGGTAAASPEAGTTCVATTPPPAPAAAASRALLWLPGRRGRLRRYKNPGLERLQEVLPANFHHLVIFVVHGRYGRLTCEGESARSPRPRRSYHTPTLVRCFHIHTSRTRTQLAAIRSHAPRPTRRASASPPRSCRSRGANSSPAAGSRDRRARRSSAQYLEPLRAHSFARRLRAAVEKSPRSGSPRCAAALKRFFGGPLSEQYVYRGPLRRIPGPHQRRAAGAGRLRRRGQAGALGRVRRHHRRHEVAEGRARRRAADPAALEASADVAVKAMKLWLSYVHPPTWRRWTRCARPERASRTPIGMGKERRRARRAERRAGGDLAENARLRRIESESDGMRRL